MTDKEIDKQIEKLKKTIAADKADNSWHFIGAPPYIIGADFLDELFKRLEGAKSESAALRETALAAVEDMKQMDKYITTSADPYAALCQVCKYKPQAGEKCKRCDVYDNTGFDWRGPKDGEKGEER